MLWMCACVLCLPSATLQAVAVLGDRVAADQQHGVAAAVDAILVDVHRYCGTTEG